MPTGYTADVGEKNITFPQFAMNCARAFGACVTMRDESTDVPIPEEFQPSDYHMKELRKTEARLGEVESMTIAEATLKATQDFNAESKRQRKEIAKDRRVTTRYKDMLYKVKQWQPPTSEHTGLKDFMIQQLESSIRFDDMEDYYLEHTEQRLTGEEWLSKQKADIQWRIDYHTKGYSEELERIASRNAWVKTLRDSLI